MDLDHMIILLSNFFWYFIGVVTFSCIMVHVIHKKWQCFCDCRRLRKLQCRRTTNTGSFQRNTRESHHPISSGSHSAGLPKENSTAGLSGPAPASDIGSHTSSSVGAISTGEKSTRTMVSNPTTASDADRKRLPMGAKPPLSSNRRLSAASTNAGADDGTAAVMPEASKSPPLRRTTPPSNHGASISTIARKFFASGSEHEEECSEGFTSSFSSNNSETGAALPKRAAQEDEEMLLRRRMKAMEWEEARRGLVECTRCAVTFSAGDGSTESS